MTNTETHTSLPTGYTTKWMTTGLKVSWKYIASNGTPVSGGTILKKGRSHRDRSYPAGMDAQGQRGRGDRSAGREVNSEQAAAREARFRQSQAWDAEGAKRMKVDPAVIECGICAALLRPTDAALALHYTWHAKMGQTMDGAS